MNPIIGGGFCHPCGLATAAATSAASPHQFLGRRLRAVAARANAPMPSMASGAGSGTSAAAVEPVKTVRDAPA
jgi:hypothetical protein